MTQEAVHTSADADLPTQIRQAVLQQKLASQEEAAHSSPGFIGPLEELFPPELVPPPRLPLPRYAAEPELPPLEPRTSYQLGELLRYEDEAFIQNAFHALFNRPPDADGGVYFLRMLRAGQLTKIDILGAMIASDEARQRHVVVHGLEKRLAIRRWQRLPVIGRFLAVAAALWRLPGTVQSVYRLTTQQARLAADVQRYLASLSAHAEEAVDRQARHAAAQLEQQALFMQRHKASVHAVGQVMDGVALLERRFAAVSAEEKSSVESLRRDLQALREELSGPSGLRTEADQTTRRLAEISTALDQLRVQLRSGLPEAATPLGALAQLLHENPSPPPLFGLPGAAASAIGPVHQCEAIADALASFGRHYRLVDFGCAAGFRAFFFAQRGAVSTGYDASPANLQLAHALRRVNLIPVEFVLHPVDLDLAQGLPHGAFDVGLLVGLLPRLIQEQGLERVRELLLELLERVPVLVLELSSGQAALLNLAFLQPLGPSAPQEDAANRLWLLTQDTVRVNATLYPVRRRSFVAYRHAPAMARQFIWSDRVFIKKYLSQGGGGSAEKWYNNLPQILREIVNHQMLADGCPAMPRLLDFDIQPDTITLVFERVDGENLVDLLARGEKVNPRLLARRLLQALHALYRAGLYHNDVRPWNVIVGQGTVWFIDLGLAMPAEKDPTIASLLWILHDAALGVLHDPGPSGRLTPPSTRLEDYDPAVRDLVAQLLNAGDLGEFFKRVDVHSL